MSRQSSAAEKRSQFEVLNYAKHVMWSMAHRLDRDEPIDAMVPQARRTNDLLCCVQLSNGDKDLLADTVAGHADRFMSFGAYRQATDIVRLGLEIIPNHPDLHEMLQLLRH